MVAASSALAREQVREDCRHLYSSVVTANDSYAVGLYTIYA